MNIITSICIDEKDDSFNYQLYYLDNQQKRITYWKCAMVFFASSYRCNPEFNRILYTNDRKEVMLGHTDIRSLLKEWGVEIRYLPFDELEKFRNLSKYHFPTLYKFLVIREIARSSEGNSMFLDSDCVWTKPFEPNAIDFERPVVYDVYQKANREDKRFNGISISEMFDLFQKIDKNFVYPSPILYGGELLGGNQQVFVSIGNELERLIRRISDQPTAKFQFPNGKSIFDGDEFLTSMAIAKMYPQVQSANSFIKRIWTRTDVNNTVDADYELVIWHMISEKLKGIPALYIQIIYKKSEFWETPISDFNIHLGSYLNVGKDKENKRSLPVQTRVQYFLQKIIFRLKAFFVRLKFQN